MEGVKKIIYSKSKTFLTFCFCFIIGVTIASGLELQKSNLFYFFILIWCLLFLLMVFWRKSNCHPERNDSGVEGSLHSADASVGMTIKRSFIFILPCLLFLILGISRVLVGVPDINKSHIAFYNGETKEFVGKVIKEPDIRIGKAYYTVSVMGIVIPTEDGGRVEESLKEK